MKKFILIISLFLSYFANAQDSLPDFSVINKGNNRIVISWNNHYKLTRQITIQRSTDSLSNFRSIVTVPDPMNRQNGFMDTKAPDDKMFYRLYILIDGSYFVYSKSKKPVSENEIPVTKTELVAPTPETDSALIKVLDKISDVKDADPSLTTEEILILKKYQNNKLAKIPDSISRRIEAVIKIKPKPELVLPMYRVVTNKDGLVQVNLKDFTEKKYTIKFFEDDDSFLFEIKTIKEATFQLDKSNFYHSGWFKSELYDNGKLIEKNRFFIPKDF